MQNELKTQVRKRSGWVCQKCGYTLPKESDLLKVFGSQKRYLTLGGNRLHLRRRVLMLSRICSCGHSYNLHKNSVMGGKDPCLINGCKCEDFEWRGFIDNFWKNSETKKGNWITTDIDSLIEPIQKPGRIEEMEE